MNISSQKCRHAEPVNEDRFPDEVTYPKQCRRGVCNESTDEATLRIYYRLLKAFENCAQRFGIGIGVSRSDVVLAIEAQLEQDESGATCFVDFRIANGTNGFVKAGQVFFMLSLMPGALPRPRPPYDGLRLHYAPDGVLVHRDPASTPRSFAVYGHGAVASWRHSTRGACLRGDVALRVESSTNTFEKHGPGRI